jgi:hypothetical protein
MKGNIKITNIMVMANTILKMVTYIKVNGFKVNFQEKENIHSKMVHIIKVNF